MITSLLSMGLLGMQAYLVSVEVDLLPSLPAFEVVGLPDAAIKESRDRIRFALKNCGYLFPNGKITVNLAPADLRKTGSLYDVPAFLGILAASGQLSLDFSGKAFLGELSLGGEVRGINGALPMVLHAKRHGVKDVFVPKANATEAAVVQGIAVYPVEHMTQLIAHLRGSELIPPMDHKTVLQAPKLSMPDFQDVKGQAAAKRALEIAAAGSHNVLLIGSPGAGKSMLAKRIPSILPAMTFEESLETTQLYSICGLLPPEQPLITTRPFRAPHHTVSPNGLSGGGSIPRPGEISLAHHGVLFLDELPEFSRPTMEILRQPMEDHTVTISRVNGVFRYPCTMMVVAAMNPCPCGYFGHPTKECTCHPGQIQRYLAKVSGPLLDRLDLHIDVAPVEYQQLTSTRPEESSADIRARVDLARKRQQARFAQTTITANAFMTPAMLQELCPMEDGASKLLQQAFDRLGLSARAYDRILKIARTIADLAGADTIAAAHIAEAIQYRTLDRKYWRR